MAVASSQNFGCDTTQRHMEESQSSTEVLLFSVDLCDSSEYLCVIRSQTASLKSQH